MSSSEAPSACSSSVIVSASTIVLMSSTSETSRAACASSDCRSKLLELLDHRSRFILVLVGDFLANGGSVDLGQGLVELLEHGAVSGLLVGDLDGGSVSGRRTGVGRGRIGAVVGIGAIGVRIGG